MGSRIVSRYQHFHRFLHLHSFYIRSSPFSTFVKFHPSFAHRAKNSFWSPHLVLVCHHVPLPLRALSTTTPRFSKEPSKVEQAVQELKEKKQQVASSPPPKRSLLKIVIDEIKHYYHGFRLLFIDIRISSRLAWKVLQGNDLTRREHKQLVRTVSDMFRLLPFSVFIIVPFMEFLLPVALKLFPGMLPSTFETSSAAEAKFKKELKVKLEMAKFLQTTLDEMALTTRGEKHSHTAKEFAEFFEKIRTSGEQASNEDILKFSKLFEDEMTLDNLTRPQLIALCRLLELQPLGTNHFLRFQLRMKLRSLKADDKMIQSEGLETLSVPELQAACRARGMRALGVPKERLQNQLKQWLELSLDEQIPQSLLLLSRALYLPENLPAPKQLEATISSLSDTALTEAKYRIGEMEGKVDNKTKIELIKKEEEAIKKEQEEEKLEQMEKEKEKEMRDKELFQEEIDLKPPVVEFVPDAMEPLKPEEKEAEINKAMQQELSKEDFENLENAMEKLAEEKRKLLIEKEELEDLKEEMAEYKEDIEQLKEVTPGTTIKESKAARRLFSRVDKMISQMDKLVEKLDKEKQTIMQQIDVKHKEGESTIKEKDDLINMNDLMLSIKQIQKISDDTRLQKIADVLDRMDIDNDGAVDVEHVLKVIELLGRDNVKITSKQMAEILEMLQKEEFLANLEKMEKKADALKNPDS